MKTPIALFWFRRDLRIDDNTALNKALQSKLPVLPIFIFDKDILTELPKDDARVTLIYETLQKLRSTLQEKHQSSIALYYSSPLDVFKNLIAEYKIEAVYTNHDYEPYARKRDQAIAEFLKENEIEFKTYKDQVIFEKDEIVKDDGDPYVVYTPYMKKWKATFKTSLLTESDTENQFRNFYKNTKLPQLTLEEIGFEKSAISVKDYDISEKLISNYKDTRDFPAENATSNLSVHLRFGTVSIRSIIKKTIVNKGEAFFNELIWREFFMQILWHFPKTTHNAFREKYDRIQWRNNETEFKKWCEGKTGYPLVDAGMRQLNETGYMHNRVRMLVASFLCKHLLIDWRWGEAYFAKKLLDYELSSNVGNWQWAAGSGVDAAPYFRIFNPTTQIKKFDKDLKYIQTWVKDYNELTYPEKIVDHKEARERCLRTYKEALK
ncbi:cryptochrome/photolyase family protein [Joostella sp. CR20]|uniref:cryptochrome/photolyase family protein n=1 Tax=Joostella sp. CR20 TaxID=2804312 RepID=UPI00313F3A35